MQMAASVLQGSSSLQSKYTRVSKNQSAFDEEDEKEMKDFKHLPKPKLVEATQKLFTKKV